VDTPGLWFAEEIVPVAPFLEHLLRKGIAPQIENTTAREQVNNG
jgi:hypothetical protein